MVKVNTKNVSFAFKDLDLVNTWDIYNVNNNLYEFWDFKFLPW